MYKYPVKVPNVTIYEGNDVTFPVYTFLDPNGVGVDLSDWAWTAEWRPTPESTRVVALNVDVTQAALGAITVVATDVHTTAMKVSGVWDLTGVLVDQTKTLVYGKTELVKRVTRI